VGGKGIFSSDVGRNNNNTITGVQRTSEIKKKFKNIKKKWKWRRVQKR